MLIGARIIGLMPITGVCERDVRRLKFNWCSAAAITSFIIMLWILFNVVLGLRVISESGFGLQNAGETVWTCEYTWNTILWALRACMWSRRTWIEWPHICCGKWKEPNRIFHWLSLPRVHAKTCKFQCVAHHIGRVERKFRWQSRHVIISATYDGWPATSAQWRMFIAIDSTNPALMHAKLEIIGAFMNLCVTYYGLVNWKSISQWHCVCVCVSNVVCATNGFSIDRQLDILFGEHGQLYGHICVHHSSAAIDGVLAQDRRQFSEGTLHQWQSTVVGQS